MIDPKEKLLDILDSIQIIQRNLESRKLHELDELQLSGVVRFLQIIGEAA
ncbi:MAG: hypothetical protein SFU25_09210 [Candidatus Caenarcaniphilales bacterium]|nr:hypothetical protein [Candidatus Caenarcaniphilales bacterium]